MFDQRPIDLHLLVYCMALAEGLVTLYDLPKEERKVLNSGGKSANNRFNRMTLRSNRLSFCKFFTLIILFLSSTTFNNP